jgi:hypothetical protein
MVALVAEAAEQDQVARALVTDALVGVVVDFEVPRVPAYLAVIPGALEG